MRAPPLLRKEVATILGEIGPPAVVAVPQLIDLLQESEPQNTREAAIVALGKLGKEAKAAIDPLLAILKDTRRLTLSVGAARALAEISGAEEKVRSAVEQLWNSTFSCPKSRVQVSIALCRLKCRAPLLLSSLAATVMTSPKPCLRAGAVEALVCCNKSDPGVIPALVAALFDEDEMVRQLAENGLSRMRVSSAKAIRLSVQQLKDCPCAETALRRAGPLAVPVLKEALKEEDALIREQAARTLGSLGETATEAVDALTKALRDRNSFVRLSAAKALWNITKRAEEVVPALNGLLSGKWNPPPQDGEARRRFLQSVIEALGRIGSPAQAATASLRHCAEDENRLIRESALKSLGQINTGATTARMATIG